jgi:hypothetical protein
VLEEVSVHEYCITGEVCLHEIDVTVEAGASKVRSPDAHSFSRRIPQRTEETAQNAVCERCAAMVDIVAWCKTRKVASAFGVSGVGEAGAGARELHTSASGGVRYRIRAMRTVRIERWQLGEREADHIAASPFGALTVMICGGVPVERRLNATGATTLA